MLYLIQSLYYLIPISALVFFAVSLILYIKARRKNKRIPGSYSASQLKTRLILLIVSAVIFGIMALVVVAFFLLLLMAVAFM